MREAGAIDVATPGGDSLLVLSWPLERLWAGADSLVNQLAHLASHSLLPWMPRFGRRRPSRPALRGDIGLPARGASATVSGLPIRHARQTPCRWDRIGDTPRTSCG